MTPTAPGSAVLSLDRSRAALPRGNQLIRRALAQAAPLSAVFAGFAWILLTLVAMFEVAVDSLMPLAVALVTLALATAGMKARLAMGSRLGDLGSFATYIGVFLLGGIVWQWWPLPTLGYFFLAAGIILVPLGALLFAIGIITAGANTWIGAALVAAGAPGTFLNLLSGGQAWPVWLALPFGMGWVVLGVELATGDRRRSKQGQHRPPGS